MPSKKVTVYDAEGIRREVYPVDAAEIVKNGGSFNPPEFKLADDKYYKVLVTKPHEINCINYEPGIHQLKKGIAYFLIIIDKAHFLDEKDIAQMREIIITGTSLLTLDGVSSSISLSANEKVVKEVPEDIAKHLVNQGKARYKTRQVYLKEPRQLNDKTFFEGFAWITEDEAELLKDIILPYEEAQSIEQKTPVLEIKKNDDLSQQKQINEFLGENSTIQNMHTDLAKKPKEEKRTFGGDREENILALLFMLDELKANCTQREKAKFIQFLTGYSEKKIEQDYKSISNYQDAGNPLTFKKWQEKMNGIKNYFQNIGLVDLAEKVEIVIENYSEE